MLPEDWATPAAAGDFTWSPARKEELRARYGQVGSLRQLDRIFTLVDQLGAKRVVLEAPYIDFDFRSEFSQHFARRFRPPPDATERLLFFEGAELTSRLLGMTVLRPTAKPVGRTVMAVPDALSPFVTVTARQPVSALGYRHEVDGFPFMSQDGEYGRCAQSVIWSIARWAHLRHKSGRHSMAAVIEAAGVGHMPDRTSVSVGLTLMEVRQALRNFGLPMMMYKPSRQLKGMSFESAIRAYLDSGFPVALNTPHHLTALVGYGIGEDGTAHWIRSDDNEGPYRHVPGWSPSGYAEDGSVTAPKDSELGDWQAALISVPGRIHVPAEAAQTAAEQTLHTQVIKAEGGPSHLASHIEQSTLHRRTYAVQPAQWKVEILGDDDIPEDIRVYRIGAPTPCWAWITEFSLPGEDGVVATIMIDATSAKHAPEPVLADIDGWCVRWDDDGQADADQRVKRGGRYPSRMSSRGWTAEAAALFETPAVAVA